MHHHTLKFIETVGYRSNPMRSFYHFECSGCKIDRYISIADFWRKRGWGL